MIGLAAAAVRHGLRVRYPHFLSPARRATLEAAIRRETTEANERWATTAGGAKVRKG
mgnify:CR=1 FL=1